MAEGDERMFDRNTDKNTILLALAIEDEKAESSCSDADKARLQELLNEVNAAVGTDFHYLSELEHYAIRGIGEIVARHIYSFESETIRSYLIHQLTCNRVENCGRLLYDLYMHFKASDEYISRAGKPSPVHFYIRYDNEFRRLKPKRLKTELYALVHNPRDAFYLPFTLEMVASWKIDGMEELLFSFLNGEAITDESVGGCPGYPHLKDKQKQLMFRALGCLKYYPSDANRALMQHYAESANKDVQAAALKTLKYYDRPKRGKAAGLSPSK